MRMNPGIILGIEPVNAMNALSQGAQTANAINTVRENNALAPFRRQQAELGVQQGQANLELTRERLTQIRQQSKMAAQEAARQGKAQQMAADLAREQGIVARAMAAYDQGGQEAADAIYMSDPETAEYRGQDPRIIGAGMIGMTEGLNEAQEFMKSGRPEVDWEINEDTGQAVNKADPLAGAQNIPNYRLPEEQPKPGNDYERYAARERAAGREPLSEFEYRKRVAEASNTGDYMEFTLPDGTTFRQGAGGQQVAPAQVQQPTQPQTPPPSGGEEAFGFGGLLRSGVNTVSDAIGLGEPFENAAEQSRFFRLLEEDLLVGLSQAYGRQPAQQLMERLRNLLPNPGSLEGADRAYGELEQLERRFERDMQVFRRNLANASGRNSGEIVQQMNGLQAALATIQEAKQRLRPTDGVSGTTSSGIKFKVIE